MATFTRLAFSVLVAWIAGTGALHAKTIEVKIENLAYVPSVVTAEPGDIIRWVNSDPFDHTATVDGKWEVLIPAGKTVEQPLRMSEAAVFYCRFHPTMTGAIDMKGSN